MEKPHALSFLDMTVYVDEQRKVSGIWYQKPRDSGTILNFCSCAPPFSKSKTRVRSTSSWHCFEKARKSTKRYGEKINCRRIGRQALIIRQLEKKLGESKKSAKTTTENKSKAKLRHRDIPTLFIPYRRQ